MKASACESGALWSKLTKRSSFIKDSVKSVQEKLRSIDGMEDFLIQPTAWYYARYLGQSNVYLGFLVASFDIGVLIFSPIIGALDTRYNIPKPLLVMGAMTKFIGNVFYTIPVNEYFPLAGRFMSGIAEGTVGVVYGAIAQGTTDINRPLAFLYFEGLYGIGSSFGPMIASFLTFNVDILGLKINPGNSPGLILTVVWFLLLILTLFLPNDLTENKSKDLQEISLSDDEEEAASEKTAISEAKQYSTSRICCLYFVMCQSWFISSIVGFYTPLLSVHQLGLGLIEIKLIYANGALFSLILFLTSFIISSYVSEKNLITVGILSHIVPLSILFYFALSWGNFHSVNNAYFLLLLDISLGVSFVIFPLASSLLSKETPVRTATLYQSLAFMTLAIADVCAPLIGGATFHKTALSWVCIGLTIGWLIELVWFLMEYRNMFPVLEKRN